MRPSERKTRRLKSNGGAVLKKSAIMVALKLHEGNNGILAQYLERPTMFRPGVDDLKPFHHPAAPSDPAI